MVGSIRWNGDGIFSISQRTRVLNTHFRRLSFCMALRLAVITSPGELCGQVFFMFTNTKRPNVS